MKLLFISLLVHVLSATTTTAGAINGELPPNHPPQLHEFAGQLRCPYAEQWLTKGPKQAARDLGLTPTPNNHHHHERQQHVRRQQEQEESLRGSCVFTNPFSGTPTCTEMRGNLWTLESMQKRCSEAGADGVVAVGEPCQVTGTLAGFCIVSPQQQGMTEATAFALGGSTATCTAAENTCVTFLQGTFEPADECATAAAAADDDDDTSGTASEVICEIAPGPIGAAHQAAYSSGYRTNCPGTPAEGSPYMWPTRWTADVDTKSMAFGSDEVVYHSVGKVWYRLDKNWKRQDTYYTRGVQRAIGQSPCPEENIVDTNGPVLSCRRDSDSRRTMIHRGSKMFFISWINGTAQDDDSAENIESCSWLDLQVVGNIRPDWYMDARGDSTDTQYMGDQHVYHDGVPRLVKQWRKTDFADQYFTMSMLANPVPAVATDDDNNNSTNSIHWPMILNIPGEGFGDDFLQSYTNHELLTEEDEAQFLLDQALEATGGSCPQIESEGVAGPPVGLTEPVPSNLEIDPNAWFSNVYTFSPIWEPPVEEEEDNDMSSAMGGAAVTEAGSVVVESCWDPNTSAVDLTVTFTDSGDGSELPWMALGYRKDEECLMTPRGGGDSEIILLSNDPQNNNILGAFYGALSPAAKSFDADAVGAIYASLVALDQATGFSNVQVSVLSEEEDTAISSASLKMPEGSVQLHFQQSMEDAPDVMYLMYAIGSSPQLGYHGSRLCFEVVDFPNCTTSSSSKESDEVSTEESSATTSGTTGGSTESGSLQLLYSGSFTIILLAISLPAIFV